MAVHALSPRILKVLGLEITQPDFVDLVEHLPDSLLERLALHVRHEVEARKRAGRMAESMIAFIHCESGTVD